MRLPLSAVPGDYRRGWLRRWHRLRRGWRLPFWLRCGWRLDRLGGSGSYIRAQTLRLYRAAATRGFVCRLLALEVALHISGFIAYRLDCALDVLLRHAAAPNARGSGPTDVPKAFSLVAEAHDRALIVVVVPVTWVNRLADSGFRGTLSFASMFYTKEFVELGGLMSYEPSSVDQFERAATYVDKILKGVKPADLPVQQPTKFELFVNLKTTKVIGITIPESMLLRADQVIK